jgi:hypothetical protein
MRVGLWMTLCGIAALGLMSCADSGADALGVGAACTDDAMCASYAASDSPVLVCLTAFKGGYCGLQGCVDNTDCPESSACVAMDDASYCFRQCLDKAECNENRTEDDAANCSSSVTFVDPETDGKACVPPSGQ